MFNISPQKWHFEHDFPNFPRWDMYPFPGRVARLNLPIRTSDPDPHRLLHDSRLFGSDLPGTTMAQLHQPSQAQGMAPCYFGHGFWWGSGLSRWLFLSPKKKGCKNQPSFKIAKKMLSGLNILNLGVNLALLKGAANKGPVDHKSPGFATDSYGAIWIGVRGRTVLFQGEQKHQRLRMSNQKNMDMGVSKNSGTPKWMVYNGKPY